MSEWTAVLPGVQVLFDLGQKPQVENGGDLLSQCYELRGAVDLARIGSAIQRLHDSHDALRLRYRVQDDGVGMVSADPRGEVPYQLLRPTGWDESTLTRLVPAIGTQMAAAWDPLSPVSARWALLQLAPDRHLLATWYFRLSIDSRSLTTLNALLWETYFHPEHPMPSSSYLLAIQTQVGRPERPGASAFWQTERDRLEDAPWDLSDLSAGESCATVVADERYEELRRAASREGVSVSQLIAHRFARAALETNDDRPILLHHFVNERDQRTADVAGNFSTVVPVVLGPSDTSSPRSTAKKLLRAFSMRPRTPGKHAPTAYVELNHVVRGFSYNYLPAHFQDDIRPNDELAVAELTSLQRVRRPSRLSLSVAERISGGLECTLSYHPDEHAEGEARRVLFTITGA